MNRIKHIFNHHPKTASVIGKVEVIEGKETVVLNPPYDKDPIYKDGANCMQWFLDQKTSE